MGDSVTRRRQLQESHASHHKPKFLLLIYNRPFFQAGRRIQV